VTLVYADSADLTAWTGTAAPSNATVLLRSASLLVRRATRSAVYAVDGTGLPADTSVSGAMRDATCAHAAALAAAGVDPLAAGTEAGAVSASSIGSASVTFADSAAAAAARARLSDRLVPEALAVLAAADLLSGAPVATRDGD
jgi:hypothetical protein